ncbi:serine protease [Aliivibrio fischeri]|nr:serine protease [Aliivibrio fischeri]
MIILIWMVIMRHVFRLNLWFVFLAIFLFTPYLYAEPIKEPSRPKIALVLAGGGAKGAAHIGVLKALEELNIPIDIITGTSMGAYVGGLYATGKSVSEIEAYLHTVDWYSGYQDEVGREEKNSRDKKYEDRFAINPSLGIRKEGVKSPKSAIQGQNMLKILRETSGNPVSVTSFDDFPIRYRSVATDIVSMEEVVIDHGLLVDAMMASMSVPGALPPYEFEDKLLIDGGVTNNMPVELAKEMGADIVIAVDISSNYMTKEQIGSLFDVASQLTNFMVKRSTQEQAEFLTDKDILLQPRVGDIETTDFSSMPRAYQEGYDTVMTLKSRLQSLAVTPNEYAQYSNRIKQQSANVRLAQGAIIDKVEVENRSHYESDKLERFIQFEQGTSLNSDYIEDKIHALYATNRFETITYLVEEDNNENVLKVTAKEKEWGPNYLNFRFFLEEDFDTHSQYGLGTSINFTDLNDYGAELRTNVELGTDKIFDATIHYPFYLNHHFFVQSNMMYSDKKRSISTSSLEDKEPNSSMSFYPVNLRDFTVDALFGVEATKDQQLKAGILYAKGSHELTGLSAYGRTEYERLGATLEYNFDSLDSISLPTHGSLINARYLYAFDKVNSRDVDGSDHSEQYIDEFTAEALFARSIARHTFIGSAEYGITNSDDYLVPVNPIELGGFNHLSGLPRNSLIGANKIYGRLTYRYRWFENDLGMFKTAFYLGASAEYGGLWSMKSTDISSAPLIFSGSLFGGIDTPIGPIILSYGRAENGLDSVYLIVGNVE